MVKIIPQNKEIRKQRILKEFLFIFYIFCILINAYSAFIVKNIVVVIGNAFMIGFFILAIRDLGTTDIKN